MKNIYKEGLYEFQTDKEGIKNRPVVYDNATQLLDFVFEKRNIEHIEKTKIKLMADGSQDFFKISISISTEEDGEKEENDSDCIQK